MRCFCCGHILPDDSLFCQYCGQNLSRQETEKVPMSVEEGAQEKEVEVAVEEKQTESVRKTDCLQEQKHKSNGVLVGCCAVAALLLIGLGILLLRSPEPEAEQQVDIAAIAESVLYLEVYDKNGEIFASASGFLVNDQTTLVTNYHVIQDAYRLKAWTSDGTEMVEITKYLAYDEIADLAVLQCETGLSASPVSLADSDAVKQSEPVYAVGYPLGLANTLSDGIVSSRYEDAYGNDILQVTAAISEGNSGGPLLNRYGEVIGVICAYYIDGQNLNIAISSNTLRELLESAGEAVALEDWVDRPLMPDQEPVEESEPSLEPVEEPKPKPEQKTETKPEPVPTPESELESTTIPDISLPQYASAYDFLSDWVVANSNTTFEGNPAYQHTTVLDGLDATFDLVDWPSRNMICVSMTLYDESGFATTFLWLTPTGNAYIYDYVYQQYGDDFYLQGRGTLYAANPNAFGFSQYIGAPEKESLCRDLAVWMCEDSITFLNSIFIVYAISEGYSFSAADFGFVC